MVISAAKPNVAPLKNGSSRVPGETTNGATTARRTHCPRCSTLLTMTYDELECLQCGYVDYMYVPQNLGKKKKSIVSTGTRFVLRYSGDFPSLRDTLTHVRLYRVRNRVVYGVNCPFCGRPMGQSSLSGKRREIREERYKCVEGHRVSLTPDVDGTLHWK